jgi:hypothetical protein
MNRHVLIGGDSAGHIVEADGHGVIRVLGQRYEPHTIGGTGAVLYVWVGLSLPEAASTLTDAYRRDVL